MELVLHNDKFTASTVSPQSQFYNIYTSRHKIISDFIFPRLQPPIAKNISAIPQTGVCSFVAIVDKHSSQRITNISGDIEPSDKDTIYLEDSSGRVCAEGLLPSLYMTGVIIGVKGVMNKDNTKFIVKKTYEPLIEEIPTKLLSFPLKLAIISELHLNSHEFDLTVAKKFMADLSGVSLLIVIGSTFSTIDTLGDLSDDWQIKKEIIDTSPMQMLEYIFENVMCQKIIVPGFSDPTDSFWPQTPIERLFLNGVDKIESTTNPAFVDVNDIKFVICSGDAVRDVVNETTYSFNESQIMLLRWRLLAPSMPGLIRPDPSAVSEQLVLADPVPNFFVCGGADTFRYSDFCGINVISVPSFCRENEAVFIDLNSGEVSSKRYSSCE